MTPDAMAYNTASQQVRHLINPNNPNLKNQVGEFIYEYVEKIAGEEQAPKITGMLIDLPLQDIFNYVGDYFILERKVIEANKLLKSQ